MTKAVALTSRQVAQELETTPKRLRTFLRQHPNYGGVGSGGHYEFKRADLARMRKAYDAWASTKATTTRRSRVSDSEGEPGMPASILRTKDPKVKAEVRRRAEARIDRLEQQLIASGHHISQK